MMPTPTTLEEIARQALAGDRDALDALVRAIQADIYALALRMLWNREDAEDATQEILVRIVTRLSQFNFRSRLKTWAYRVAVNCILDTKKSAIERLHLNFERFADDLTSGLEAASADDREQSILIEEVKVGCTMAMLQCLDRDHRLAYVLGEIMELSGPEAADTLSISPDLFRKRLQHARIAILTFMRAHCGLVSDAAPCRCNRRVAADALGDVEAQPVRLQFARSGTSFVQLRDVVRQVDEARWEAQIHRSNRPRESSIDFARRLADAIDGLSGPRSDH
jgi:RNA polymerase sigma factor (sigma-70 family)